MTHPAPDSRYAALRLVVALALMTVGNGAMYIVIVVLPAVQAEFGVARAAASLPYTLTMIGFGFGGILMGRLADRFGVMVPLLIGGLPSRWDSASVAAPAASGSSPWPTACWSGASAARRCSRR